MNGCVLAVGAAIFGIVFFVGMTTNHARIDKETAAFATKCNESGRIARRIDGMLQCVTPNQSAKEPA